jgi:hypothetical protein
VSRNRLRANRPLYRVKSTSLTVNRLFPDRLLTNRQGETPSRGHQRGGEFPARRSIVAA